MSALNVAPPEFRSGDKIVSLVYHPPEIKPGTKATIVNPWFGPLIAVQLPNGELHRWFAWFELEPVNSAGPDSIFLKPGDRAIVISTEGHPPHIKIGTEVKIVKVIPSAIFYDLMLEGNMYHRWLAEFEIVPASLVGQ